MITVRKANERGHANTGWLDSFHTFSFADYFDPANMGFRSLRVVNEDRVAAGAGFEMHPHRDLEILTYILSGALLHRDSLGHKTVLKAGEMQRITAGRGIEHSEFNYSQTEPVHLLQVWIIPERPGLEPAYDLKSWVDAPPGRLTLVASPSARDGSLKVHQDAELYLGKFVNETIPFNLRPGRALWLQATDGALSVNGLPLAAGDGAAINEEETVELSAASSAHFLLFDLN